MIEKTNSTESKEEIYKYVRKKSAEGKYSINPEYCWKNCLKRFGSTTVEKHIDEFKHTSINQKEPAQQATKPFIETNSPINSKDQNKKPNILSKIPSDKNENDCKLSLNCREGKICPTISLLVNQKKLEQVARLAIESALNHKLSELLSPGISQKPSSENKQQNENKPLQNTEIPTTVPFSNNANTKNESDISKRNEKRKPSPVFLPISPKEKRKRNSYIYNSNSNKIETDRPKNAEINTDIENPSTEIKSTDLSVKPNQHSVIIHSSEHDDENELDKWKRNCQEGNYALESLVDKCDKDPNSVLATFKVSLGTDRKLPNGSFEAVAEQEPLYILRKTHGENLGDPKYHLLMVDASTSLHKIDYTFIPKEVEQLDKISEQTVPSEEVVVIEEEIIPEKIYQTSAPPNMEQKSDETIPEVVQLQQSLLSQTPRSPPKSPLQSPQQSPRQSPQQSPRQSPQQSPQQSPRQSPQQSPQQSPRQSPRQSPQQSPPESQQQSPRPSIIKEHKPSTYTREKKASINFKEDDEEDRKRQNAKRPSGVSWRALNPPSDSDSTASLEQVVKDATAKAETFRQNLDAKRQHSLLDIAKRKSTIDKRIEEPKPPSPPPPPPKRRKFFNFKCLEKKKPEKEKEPAHSDSEESDEELPEKKPATSSSLYLDNYKRRNTSFIENPVFEKKKELNQFLNNI